MNTVYVTSAHYRTPSGCPELDSLVTAIERSPRLENLQPPSRECEPLRPSKSTLRQMTQRFKRAV